jgi:hypothetical protein
MDTYDNMTIITDGKPERRKRIDIVKQADDPNQYSHLLTDKEREEIRADARELVKKELKNRAEKALLDQYVKEEREAIDPDQVLVPIFLQLAGHSNYIMLDGVLYHHEKLHHVTPAVFATLAEIQARGWAHEEETEVRDTRTRRRARPPAHVGVGNFQDHRAPRDLVVSSGQLAGSSAGALLGLRG